MPSLSFEDSTFCNCSGLLKTIIRRYTCSKIAVLFTGFFQAALFSSADLPRNKDFLLAESPFFSLSQQKKKNCSKRTAERNAFSKHVNRLYISIMPCFLNTVISIFSISNRLLKIFVPSGDKWYHLRLSLKNISFTDFRMFKVRFS